MSKIETTSKLLVRLVDMIKLRGQGRRRRRGNALWRSIPNKQCSLCPPTAITPGRGPHPRTLPPRPSPHPKNPKSACHPESLIPRPDLHLIKFVPSHWYRPHAFAPKMSHNNIAKPTINIAPRKSNPTFWPISYNHPDLCICPPDPKKLK